MNVVKREGNKLLLLLLLLLSNEMYFTSVMSTYDLSRKCRIQRRKAPGKLRTERASLPTKTRV